MKRLVTCAALVLVACSGSQTTAPPATTTTPADKPDAGWVTIAPGSAMLGQIKREPAAVTDVPSDEIVSPGKIEVNPNHLSKVALPVEGRVTRVPGAPAPIARPMRSMPRAMALAAKRRV